MTERINVYKIGKSPEELQKALMDLRSEYDAHIHDGVSSKTFQTTIADTISTRTMLIRKLSYTDNTNGLWMGIASETMLFNLGNATNYLKWDGSSLSVSGSVTATSGTFTGTVNATAGKFGTSTNYWSVGSTGLTAVSASTDVIINYGKTDFGQDSTAGFILGYDYSATKAKFEIGTTATGLLKYDGSLSVVGGTITGGTIQTATTGQRVVISGSSNSLSFYDAGGQIIGIGTDGSRAIDIVCNNTINNGVLVTSSYAGNGFYYSNTADVGGRGLYIEQTNNGSNNTQPCAELNHDGHYYGMLIEATHSAGGIYISNSGALSSLYLSHTANSVGIYVNNSGTSNSISVDNSGNGDAVYIVNSGTGKTVNISSTDTGADNALYISNARGNTAALYVTKSSSAPGRCIELYQSVNSATSVEGIVFDLANAGAGLEHAFSFQGSEHVAASVSGTQDQKIRVLIGGTPYYIPCYTA